MTGNILSSSKAKTGKNTVIEDLEDEIYELPDSNFTKTAAIVFYKINNGKDGVFPSSEFVDLIEKLGRFFIVSIWRVICGK